VVADNLELRVGSGGLEGMVWVEEGFAEPGRISRLQLKACDVVWRNLLFCGG
jgi:hypothetical protein